MNKQEKTPAMPLAGGDYVDKGNGLKQVAPSTEPPVGKSEQAATTTRRAPAPAPAADPTSAASTRTTTTTSKTP